jgi:hypothetical protein
VNAGIDSLVVANADVVGGEGTKGRRWKGRGRAQSVVAVEDR